MAWTWRRRRNGFAGWAVAAAAGLGVAAALAFLEPARRERAREALGRAGAGVRRALGSIRAVAR